MLELLFKHNVQFITEHWEEKMMLCKITSQVVMIVSDSYYTTSAVVFFLRGAQTLAQS